MGDHFRVVHRGQDRAGEDEGHQYDDRGGQGRPQVRISRTTAITGTAVVQAAMSA